MKSLKIVVLLVIFVSVIDIGVCKDESLNADGTSKVPIDMAAFRHGLIGLFQEKTGNAIPKKEAQKALLKRRLEATAVETPNTDGTSKVPLDMAAFRHGLIELFKPKTGYAIPKKGAVPVLAKRQLGSMAEKKNYRNNNAKIEKALDQAGEIKGASLEKGDVVENKVGLIAANSRKYAKRLRDMADRADKVAVRAEGMVGKWRKIRKQQGGEAKAVGVIKRLLTRD